MFIKTCHSIPIVQKREYHTYLHNPVKHKEISYPQVEDLRDKLESRLMSGHRWEEVVQGLLSARPRPTLTRLQVDMYRQTDIPTLTRLKVDLRRPADKRYAVFILTLT